MTNQRHITVVHSLSRWLPQTATWLYTQVRFLPDDFTSHIVCDFVENLDQFPHPNVHALENEPKLRSLWDRALRRLGIRRHIGFLVREARKHDASILHSHFGNTGWRDANAARQLGLKHVVTFYGLDVVYYPTSDPRWKDRYRDLFAGVDRVLCEGPHMASQIEALGCARDKIRVHHLGIDVARIPFEPRQWRPGEPLRVLMAGSFREKKGFPYAVEALAAVSGEVALEITIIGDEHGEERTKREKAKIIAALDAGGLRDRTRMLGYQPYDVVLEEARCHHIFLSPSVTASDGDTEGGAPVSLIETSASGMMVVSTTHCDIPGVIRDGETGLLAPERDVPALVERLRWFVAHPGRWHGMAQAGRRHIEAEFDAPVQGRRLGEIYRELVGVSKAAGS